MHPCRQLRRLAALTQEELAARAGVDRVTIVMFEKGKREPHPKTLRAIAGALGVAPAKLLQPERMNRG